MFRFLIKPLKLSLFLYFLIIAYVYFNQQNLLYHPYDDKSTPQMFGMQKTKEVFLEASDGNKIQAWYKKPGKLGKMVIFYHGNTGNIPYKIDKLSVLDDLGYGYLIPSWRGFGKSEGKPSKEGIYNDARAAVEFLNSEGYDVAKDVILVGESLGSGVAVKMASEHKFLAMFLITPYDSMANVANFHYPFLPARLLIKDNYNAIDHIEQVDIPMLIIHGDDDKTIPDELSASLFAKAQMEQKKRIIYKDIGHTTYDNEVVFTEMSKFFGIME
jgi:pimeloyl-ACP methyl ester carboxylesterase